MLTKIISVPSFKINILHAKFSTIPGNRIRDRIITRILEKKRNSSTRCRATYTQIVSLLLLIMHILYINFCAINRSRYYYLQNSGKFFITAPSIRLCSHKLYQWDILKYACCRQNFVQFHAIESETESSAPTDLFEQKLNHCYF